MWCGAASAVTASPSSLARRTSSTEPAVDRWRKCTGAPVRRDSAMSRATMASSAAAGMPGRPSRLDQDEHPARVISTPAAGRERGKGRRALRTATEDTAQPTRDCDLDT